MESNFFEFTTMNDERMLFNTSYIDSIRASENGGSLLHFRPLSIPPSQTTSTVVEVKESYTVLKKCLLGL